MKVAIIGAGRQGKRHALSIKQTGLGEVVLVIDANQELAAGLAEEYGAKSGADIQEVIGRKDIDAVVVATPVAAHHQAVIDCLGTGKHVFCEKPLALTSKQAQEMADAAEKSGRILQCAFIMRHHPGMRQLKDWVDAGELGDITYAHCEYARSKNFANTWRADKSQSGGGNLHDQAIHVIDLFRWYMGDLREGASYRTTAVWDMAPLEDDVAGVLRAASGAVAGFHVSYARWQPLFVFELGGTKALVRIEGMGNPDYGTQKVTLVRRNDETGLGDAEKPLEFFGPDKPWNDEWIEFCEAVEQHRRPIGDGQDGVEALKLVETLYASSIYVDRSTK